MDLPNDIEWVTFDMYGTLVDWERGVYEAFRDEAAEDGFTVSRKELIPVFHEVEREITTSAYELYAEVLRRTAMGVAERIGWSLDPSRSNFLPDSLHNWPIFRDANAQLKKLGKLYKVGIISNIDDKLLGYTRHQIIHDFDLVVTAQQVRSYKPELAHFQEFARRIGAKKKNWVHVSSSYHHDIEPCAKSKIASIWINRKEETAGKRKPTAEVPSLLEAARLLGTK